jgi:LPS sulfotransferase NodH
MPLFFRPQVTPYIILFIERDGSTYMTSLLMSHPHIQAIYERFAVLKQKGASAQEQLAWAENFYTPPLLSRKSALGFKTKLVDVLDLAGFTDLLHRKNVRVIQMQRRNRVKAVISRINAARLHEASGKWNLYDESDRLPPLQVDLEQFSQYLNEREATDAELDNYVSSLQLPKHKIIYEELLVDKDRTLNELLDFLQVTRLALQSKTLKNTRDDLREAVSNLDELQAHYAGTIYADMFTEVLV